MEIVKYCNTFFIITIFLSTLIFSQEDLNQPCSSFEAMQFDFWIGEWKVEWKNSDGSRGEGTNSIKKVLNGCVIEENFDTDSGNNLKGKSFSVYNQYIKKWQQTWVDNYGNFMVFTGNYADDKMILEREIMDSEGKKLRQRMIFYDITEDEFKWNWEKSSDDEENWHLSWQIHYFRKK